MTKRLGEQLLERSMINKVQSAHEPPLGHAVRDLEDQKAGHQRIALLAKMQDVASSMIEKNSFRQDLSVDRLSLIRPITNFHHYTLKTSERTGHRVLIEYLDYKGAVVARVNEIMERVNAIASLRNQGIIRDIFPMLKC